MLKKLALFILIIFYFYYSESQDIKKISIEKNTYSIEAFFNLLSNHFDNLVFSTSLLPQKTVTIKEGNYTLYECLDLLALYGITYRTINQQVLIQIHYKKPIYTLYGYVKDQNSKEALINAFITEESSNVSTVSNEYGFFSIKLFEGKHKIKINYLGYETVIDTLFIDKNTINFFEMKPISTYLEEIIIQDSDSLTELEDVQNHEVIGINNLKLDAKVEMPFFLGEIDILQKMIQYPGVYTIGEDGDGLIIRGSPSDNHYFFLDDAIIYNPKHYFGLVSVFNPDIVNNVRLIKGYMPASYGGRTSSVIEVHHKEGDKEKFKITGGIGFLSGRLAVEGPIIKNKSSYIVAVRRSIFDYTFDNINNANINTNNFSFYDINIKTNYILNAKNTVFASLYIGNDENENFFGVEKSWGNKIVSLRWNHLYNNGLFSNYSYSYNNYTFSTINPNEPASFIGKLSNISHFVNLKHEIQQNLYTKLDFGANFLIHDFNPGVRLPYKNEDENIQSFSSTNPFSIDKENGLEFGFYLSHESNYFKNFNIKYGLRWSGLLRLGNQKTFIYDANLPKSNHTITDTLINDYSNFSELEPRFSMSWNFKSNQHIRFFFSKTVQYLHLVSNTTSPIPSNIWKLSDSYFNPQIAFQYSLGYFNFINSNWSFSIDLFYKDLQNIIDFKDGQDLFFTETPEIGLLTGSGYARGIEFYIKGKIDKINGWLSYTISNSEQKIASQFEEETINKGAFYPSDYDKTHILNFVTFYNINSRFTLSSTFNFSTGRPYSIPVGKYEINNNVIPDFAFQNNGRIRSYNRWDISLTWDLNQRKKERKYKHYLIFSVYNVLAINNAYTYYYEENKDKKGDLILKEVNIFSNILPSVSYNFKLF